LQKFKERNGTCQIKLHGEAGSVDENIITKSLSLLQSKCSEYSLDRRKKNKERISVPLCANADGFYKLAPLIIGKYANPDVSK
ncbi:9780_t:CDS:2, partial [Racocetra persica]